MTQHANQLKQHIETPYTATEELMNSVTHGLGVVLSIIGLIALIYDAINTDNLIKLISVSVYGSSLIVLFLASTVYHFVTKPRLKSTFKLLDHCAIYLLIAGSYTPLMLVTLKGSVGYAMLGIVWGLAILGIGFKVVFGTRYKVISLATYLIMGFISVFIINKLFQTLPFEGMSLLVAGGAIYTIGVYFYVKKSIPFNHAIWHLLVLAAAACHFALIYHYV
ncbi:hemolysin III family protein [Parashewanella spongiae]|uniref:Hemolysin III family protein n=1 Tax=Parashewanella spongiae TaxID=342950 RepID=A0A3A6TM28_9GAMM|nr:hemolysin III family protein [Parashewanella spongiae]MCL1079897.1 hemolysin III family protein [Parashewanella spongiae]RJY02333.1 hemolysin III family protein [Parashewanella spongiae]